MTSKTVVPLPLSSTARGSDTGRGAEGPAEVAGLRADMAAAERAGIEPHVSLNEACQALGLRPQTVYRWACEGSPKWAAFRAWRNPSGHWRIPVAALRDIQAEGEHGVGLARPSKRRRG